MTAATAAKHIACAIYTRKSTDDGMDKEFTSIEAQRLSALQYISNATRRKAITRSPTSTTTTAIPAAT